MSSNILDSVFEGCPPITHEQARDAAQDLLNHYFKNEPRKGGGVLVSIPVRPDNTDVILMRYIQEQERKDNPAAVAALIEAAEEVLAYMDVCNDKGDLERNLRTALTALRGAQ